MGIILTKIRMLLAQKKGLFLFLILFSILLIVIGVVAAINLSGSDLVVDFSHISYIKFLKNESGFVSFVFKLLISLLIFLLIICLCGVKAYLMPVGILFYGYLVYSQVVIFVSMIMYYGIFNCLIFACLLLVYIVSISIVFALIIVEISCCCNSNNYCRTLFSWQNSCFVLFMICLLLATFIFCLILTILKSFVLLLMY